MSDLENVKPKADDVEGHMILPLDDEIIPRNATDKLGRPPRKLVDYDDVEGHEHKHGSIPPPRMDKHVKDEPAE